jgi:TetR/AcrR family transcriptional regulator
VGTVKIQQRHPEAAKTAILDAAERLFAEKGFAATSMRDLAEASGVSKALMHHHFGSKEDLYLAVKRRIVQRCLEVHQPHLAEGVEPAQQLVEGIRTLFRFYGDNPTVLRIWAWSQLEGDVDVWPWEEVHVHSMLERVEDLKRSGVLRGDLDPALMLVVIRAMAFHWWQFRQTHTRQFEHLNGRETLDEDYLEQVLQIVARGVAGPAFPGDLSAASASTGKDK